MRAIAVRMAIQWWRMQRGSGAGGVFTYDSRQYHRRFMRWDWRLLKRRIRRGLVRAATA